MRTTLLLLLMAMIAFSLFGLLEDAMLYHPPADLHTNPEGLGMPSEELHLPTTDGETIFAWFMPAEQAKATVLMAHGNAENVSDTLPAAWWFWQHGYSVLTFDFRGYGKSTGKPSEQGLYRDIEACWRHLVVERGLDPASIVLFGFSLGSGPVVELAAREKPGLVVLQAAFLSTREVGRDFFGWFAVYRLVGNKYDNASKVSSIQAPVIVAHGICDGVVESRHGLELFRLVRSPKHLLLHKKADHGTIFDLEREVYIELFEAWLAGTFPDSSSEAIQPGGRQ